MIKLIVTGIWVCVVALGAVFLSIEMATRKDTPAEVTSDPNAGVEKLRGEITSIPVISKGVVHGYFLTRLSYTVDPKKLAASLVPVPELVTDVLYSELVGNRLIDFPNIEKFDLDGFRKNVLAALNTRLGDDAFKEVIVEQIDFLSKDEIRSNMRSGNFTMKAGAPIGQGPAQPEAPALATPEAAPAH